MKFLLRVSAVLVSGIALATSNSAQQEPTSTPEVFEKVDPYTKGKPELLDKAGYVSFGPFPLAEGIRTSDVEEVLGGAQVLWVETAHIKLGTLLRTYRRGTDDREEQRLAEELVRLAKKLPRVRKDARELDPWLRLHLYAQRLEEQFAAFQSLAGVADRDFGPKEKNAATRGVGAFLGNDLKYVVILFERKTQMDRFARRWVGPESSSWHRVRLPGGAWFVGMSAETILTGGAELESAFHAFVASGFAYSLAGSFCGAEHARPLWLMQGLALYFGRLAEPRWSVFIERKSTGPDDESWKFEERLRDLIQNKFIPSFEEMFAWSELAAFEARHHMTAWSRVQWLVEDDKALFGQYLRVLCQAREANPAGGQTSDEARWKAALETLYKRTLPELDADWRKAALRKGSRR